RRIDAESIRQRGGDVAHSLGMPRRLPFAEVEPLAERDRQLRRRERVQALRPPRERPGCIEAEERPPASVFADQQTLRLTRKPTGCDVSRKYRPQAAAPSAIAPSTN